MSLTLGRVRGIPVRLHGSFVLLAGGYVLWQLLTGGLGAAASAGLLGALLFGSVALHELGHALTARRFNIPTRSITLYPFGGIAALEREPDDPTAELAVAIAGPAVNVGLAALAAPIWLMGSQIAGLFAALNLGMAVFNMLPAFPMDGGRVLRAWLSRRLGYVAATDRALRVGRVFAWGMFLLGLFGNVSLMLVGGFMLAATSAERRRLRSLVANQTAQRRNPNAPRRVVWSAPQREALDRRHWDHPAF